MSSILKALEKAEESHSIRRNGAESGLIRARKRRPVWIMPVAVLCGAACAALVTFAAMGGFSSSAPITPVTPVAAKPVSALVAPLNQVIEAPEAKPENTPPSEPARASVLPTQRIITPAIAPDKAVRAAKVKASHSASVRRSPVQSTPARETPVFTPPSAAMPAPARPELRVTGIAWQNNGGSSFAVVNGRAVLQGGTVDGFKVVEIHQDLVRFSGSNGNFDVPLDGDDRKQND